MKAIETCKPHTLPETCTDAALIHCYARDVLRWPGLLTGLRKSDDSLYLPQPTRQQQVAAQVA